MSFINRIVTGALLTGSALGFSGCSLNSNRDAEQRKEVLKELLADKPAKEYTKAIADWRYGTVMAAADAQSSVDSAAFRQIFDGTTAAQNSAKVKEFNAIAASTRIKGSHDTFESAQKELDKKIIDLNISTKDMVANEKEYETLTQELPSRCRRADIVSDESARLMARQFKTDSVAYTNFFKKNNLLTPEVTQQIKKVSEKIKIKP